MMTIYLIISLLFVVTFITAYVINSLSLIDLKSVFVRSLKEIIYSILKIGRILAALVLLIAKIKSDEALALLIAKVKSDIYASKIPSIANSLPEEQLRVLSDLRHVWRSRGFSSRKVKIKTYYFLFRHWWGISWSEIGKYIKGFLPNRWI